MDRLVITNVASHSTYTELPGDFRIAHGTDTKRRDHVIVAITIESTAGGQATTGWGEASPLTFFTGETAEQVRLVIDCHFSPRLQRQDPQRLPDIIKSLEHAFPHHPAALTAIDMALHDALARASGVGLGSLLGSQHSRVPVYKAVGIGTVEESVASAEELVGIGFRALKVKVGLDWRQDGKRLEAIRRAVGEEIHICADANEGYSVPDAIKFAHLASELGLQYLEQPVARWNLDGLRTVREHGALPIMADESLHDLRNAVELLSSGAVDLFGLKLVKTGGLWRAKQLAELAEAYHVPCVVISPFDSLLGAAANLHLAASLPGPLLPQGLGTSVVASGDPLGTLEFVDGFIEVPAGPGLGVHPQAEVYS